MAITEKRKRPFSSEKHKTRWRSGMFSAAKPAGLMTRGAGRWSLDTEKRKCLFSSEKEK